MDRDGDLRAPGCVHGDGSNPLARPEPRSDNLPFQQERCARPGGGPRIRSLSQKRPIGNPHGGKIQNRPEMEGEPSPSRMIAAGGVYEQHLGPLGKRSDHRLQQRSLTKGEQPGLVRCRRPPFDNGPHRPSPWAQEGRRRPGPLTSASEGRSSLEAHEALRQKNIVALGNPGLRAATGEISLCCDVLFHGVGPGALIPGRFLLARTT